MTDITFIIPISAYHKELVNRAIASVQAQTVPCTVISIQDPDGRGPSPLRNAGLSQVKTPYVSFLDADDWIEPQFAERCLSVIRPGHYVVADWWQDTEMKVCPEQPWDGTGAWHVITTLLSTADVRRVGGFDVSLPGADDTDFYWKLTRSGVMPIILHESLFHYGAEGTRAREFVKSAAYEPTMAMIVERYRYLPDPYAPPPETVNTEFPGSILVVCVWDGKQARVGQMTGMRYPKSGWGKLMWVHADDAAARPDLFRPANKPKFANPFMPSQNQIANSSPQVVHADDLDEIAALWFPNIVGRQQAARKRAEQIASTSPAAVSPDIRRLIELFDSGLESA